MTSRIFTSPPSAGGAGYLIDHSAVVFILDRTGEYVSFMPPRTSSDRMEVMVREALEIVLVSLVTSSVMVNVPARA